MICEEPYPNYPPCHLPKGHSGEHKHNDGRCQVGMKLHLRSYPASDPNRGVRWDQCLLFAGHAGQHETRREQTFVRRF